MSFVVKILDSSTNLEDVSAFADIRPLPTRIAKALASRKLRRIYTIAGMLGCGKSTAALLFGIASMQTHLVVIDAESALFDSLD